MQSFQWQKATRRAAFIFTALLSLTSAAVAGTVSISAPTSGSTLSSNFHLVASASSSSSIKAMMVYVDGAKTKSVTSSSIDTYIAASAGTHRLVVQALDGSGYFSKAISVTVGTSGSGTGSGPTSTTGSAFTTIDQMSGWEHCTVCAGTAGNGSVASYSMKQGTSSPSIDGKAITFHLGGGSAYSNALWWKQLGAKNSARHFVYDIYYYLKNPSAAQALEFDANQSMGGHKYIFGTECSMKGSRTWRIWSKARSWFSTGVPCNVPTAYAWHHLTWEFERTTSNQVKFVAVTLDGKKSYINTVVAPQSSGVSGELNVAFQMDGNRSQTPYDTWVDKITLRYW